MKNTKRYSTLVFFLLLLSGMSDAGVLPDAQSRVVKVKTILGPSDSSESRSFYQKLQWNVGLGLSRTGPRGLTASTGVSFEVNKYIGVYVSAGLVSLRGPSFAYHTEHYFSDGTGYGYEINDYIIGDYLAHQLTVGLEVKEPFLNMFSVTASPYHLRLLRSNSISHFAQVSKSGSSGGGGGDDTDSDFVSIGGFNYGFPGIHQNDFGLQLGLKFRYNRLGLSASQNIGFGDWGVDSYFGSTSEKVSFTNVQFTYLIKK